MQIKYLISVPVLLLGMSASVFAEPTKQTPQTPASKTQQEQKAEAQKQDKKKSPRKEFKPSEQVSPDIPVAFPSNI